MTKLWKSHEIYFWDLRGNPVRGKLGPTLCCDWMRESELGPWLKLGGGSHLDGTRGVVIREDIIVDEMNDCWDGRVIGTQACDNGSILNLRQQLMGFLWNHLWKLSTFKIHSLTKDWKNEPPSGNKRNTTEWQWKWVKWVIKDYSSKEVSILFFNRSLWKRIGGLILMH